MLLPLSGNVVAFTPRPIARAKGQVRARQRAPRIRLLEWAAGSLVVAWWLQVFLIWTGVLGEISFLGGWSR